LGLLTVAALLPQTWELRLADLNTRDLQEEDWRWADLLMISAMYVQREGLWALAQEARRRGKTSVAGGPYPSSLPEDALEAGCDFVVRGEAENAIHPLLEAMRHGKTGVINAPEFPDLTASPIPRYDLLRFKDYVNLSIQTSRGCPFDCEFCDVVHLFGRKPRYKTPPQVLAELETIYRLGFTGNILICDDNFIGSKEQAWALLTELTPWMKKRGAPFTFMTQVSVNLGRDLALVDLMTANNLGTVFIGIESPDEKALATSHKFHNLKNPLVESINHLKKNGMTVLGSFIFGLDGETPGTGRRIGAFVEQTAIPINMLGLLQAPPHTPLWNRLEREGRLRQDFRGGGGSFSGMNFIPGRPEAEILQEYLETWDYLYEPSRYLSRAYRYYLEMRPTRLAKAIAAGVAPPPENLPNPRQSWRCWLYEIRAFVWLLWRQGIRSPYRLQFWTQLIGIWRKNPSRMVDYIAACIMGEDLFIMRNLMRENITAIMRTRGLDVAAGED
jgi:radical SAM superfamily enzyme YgiQ (UPF0313 family)